MNNFSKNILHTIKEQQIAPRPRWMFLARQIALLSGFVLSVLIGGVSVSVILFSLSDLDWDAPRMMNMHPGPFLIAYLPYVWIALLILFGVAAYYEMRNTKSGYRYRAVTILGASLLASIFVGVVLHVFGMGRIADQRFAQAIPQYRGFDARKADLWMRPHEGMLAGRIVSGSATSTFVLEDFSGLRWTVEAADAVQRGPVEAFSGERVRISGSIVSPAVFRAVEIFPWTRRGMMPKGAGQKGMMFLRPTPDDIRERKVMHLP